MTINLLKHKNDLLATYNTILGSENADDWALFSYEGTSNTLKTEATGHGGINELRENLNSGKLMYGLIKIKDPSLPSWKLMLIHWQGECVPSIHLGSFASHIHEVKKFFKGVHLTHYARTDQDVDVESIMRSFNKVNCGTNSLIPRDVSKEPLETRSVYEKVNLKTDINAVERNKFWDETENEENRRLAEERRRILAEKRRLEEEQQKLRDKISQDSNLDASDRKQILVTSELMRRERLQEMNEMIPSKTNLKSMWEQKTSASAQQEITTSSAGHVNRPVVKKPLAPKVFFQPVEKKISPKNNGYAGEPGTKVHKDDGIIEENRNSKKQIDVPKVQDVETVTKLTEKLHMSNENLTAISNDSKFEKEQSIEKDWETITMESVNQNEIYKSESVVPAAENHVEKRAAKPGLGLQAQALWDYQASDDTEISFNPGDVITNIEQIDEGWWRGTTTDGTVGLFPANYVELLE